jgi:hypothetical protein
MSAVDLEAEPSDEQLRETASEMPVHYFLGEALKPFSIGRQLACQRVMSGTGGSALETAMVVVFSCALERHALEWTRTPEGRDKFFSDLEAWATQKGINMRNHAGAEVIRIADDIWAELEASEGKPQIKASQASKDPPDPNASCREASPPTSRRSRRSSKG